MTNTEDNWLNEARFACPGCGTRLLRVDHSPMDDGWLLYCDRCPRRAEVTFYDPAVMRIRKQENGFAEQMARIEAELRPCACGGRFLHDAPRRCHACGVEVVHESHVDVWPDISWPRSLDDEPTAEEQARYDAWEAAFVAHDGLWQDPAPDAEAR